MTNMLCSQICSALRVRAAVMLREYESTYTYVKPGVTDCQVDWWLCLPSFTLKGPPVYPVKVTLKALTSKYLTVCSLK